MGLLDMFRRAPSVLPTRVRTRADFDREVLDSATPVIVDVWGASCAPCRKLEPILVEVATRYRDRVKVVEIGTADSEPGLLAELEVTATPTLVMFRGGEELGRVAGLRPGSWFDQMIATEFPDVLEK